MILFNYVIPISLYVTVGKSHGQVEGIRQTCICITVMIKSFRTDRSGQTVQTQIRLLLKEQSDQGLHCLLFHLHLFDEKPFGLASFLDFLVDYIKVF